jgi:type II secretory pathway pseudopilin PulG
MLNEKGFSLVELAVTAAIATALAIVAVAVTAGTATSVSQKAQEAAWVEECGMQDMIAEFEVALDICTIENWQGREEYYANKNSSN